MLADGPGIEALDSEPVCRYLIYDCQGDLDFTRSRSRERCCTVDLRGSANGIWLVGTCHHLLPNIASPLRTCSTRLSQDAANPSCFRIAAFNIGHGGLGRETSSVCGILIAGLRNSHGTLKKACPACWAHATRNHGANSKAVPLLEGSQYAPISNLKPSV